MLCYVHQFVQIKNEPFTVTSEQKWEQDFPNITLNWKHIYNIPRFATIETKIRNFQYKYLMNNIPTNKHLMKLNIVSDSLCDFCSMHPETVNHMFWECRITQIFWNELQTSLNNCNVRTSLDLYTITFGKSGNSNNINVQNFIILNAKYYIHICKYRKTIPNFNCFKHFLIYKINIEKYIALLNDKLEIHNEKWSNFDRNITIS